MLYPELKFPLRMMQEAQVESQYFCKRQYQLVLKSLPMHEKHITSRLYDLLHAIKRQKAVINACKPTTSNRFTY